VGAAGSKLKAGAIIFMSRTRVLGRIGQ